MRRNQSGGGESTSRVEAIVHRLEEEEEDAQGRKKYHSIQGFSGDFPARRPRARERRGNNARPHSVDAEFLHQLERMGLSQSLPPFTTVSTKS